MYTYDAKVVRVVDGDSVWLEVDVGFHMSYKYNFRIAGINTPELRSKDPLEKEKAYAAKTRLEELLPVGQEVRVKTAKPGKYGRWLAIILLIEQNGEPPIRRPSINQIMLDEGHAQVYP